MRNRPSMTATVISFTASFLLASLSAFSLITILSIKNKESTQQVNAYGVLSTQDPSEIAQVENEIKNRLKNSSVSLIPVSKPENNLIVVSFSRNEGLKKLSTYLNTVDNVDRWIFDADLQHPIQSAENFILIAALFVFIVSLFIMLCILLLHVKSGFDLCEREIEIWKSLGARNSQIRWHFLFPLFLPSMGGAILSLTLSLLFAKDHFDPRIESPDISPILLSMTQSSNVISEIVLPTPESSFTTPPPHQTKKREWTPPLDDFWGRKRIKTIESARQGLLIEAKSGEVVSAASDGVVVYDGQIRGLGKMVIVDHGRGLHSVYAHLGEIKTHIDETLQKGQTLGYIGDNVFYFELRQNGKPKAVETFIRKP